LPPSPLGGARGVGEEPRGETHPLGGVSPGGRVKLPKGAILNTNKLKRTILHLELNIWRHPPLGGPGGGGGAKGGKPPLGGVSPGGRVKLPQGAILNTNMFK